MQLASIAKENSQSLARRYQIAALFITYSLTGWLGLSVPLSTQITLFWLPSGIAVAALYRWSHKVWPGIFCAALSICLLNGFNLSQSLLAATGNTLGPLLTVFLLRSLNCHLNMLDRSQSLIFIAVTLLSMLLPATIGSLAIGLEDQSLFTAMQFHNGLGWWMGDSLGVLLAAPALMRGTSNHIKYIMASRWHFLCLLLLSSGVAAICFPLNQFQAVSSAPIVFLTFICVAWASLTFGLIGSTLIVLICSFIAIWSTERGLGPFFTQEESASYWLIWLYSTSMALMGLIIATAHTKLGLTSAQLGVSNQEQEVQKKHLGALLQAIPDLLFEMDRTGNFLFANGSSPINQLSPSTLTNKNIVDILPPQALTIWQAALNDADQWGISHNKVIALETPQGDQQETLWFELSIAKQPGTFRHDDRFICIARDITKRIHSHKADLANEQRFRNIFEATRNIAVQGYNRFHEVIFWNKASEDLYGFSAGDAMGKKLEDLIIPGFMREGVHQAIEDWHDQNIAIPSGELALKNAQNEEVWVYSNHVLIDTPDKKEMYCLDIDLGPQRAALQQLEQELVERKLIERALRDSEQRLEAAQLNARIAHWSWHSTLDCYSFSPSMTQLFKLPSTQLNCDGNEFLPLINTKDRALFVSALKRSINQQKPLWIELQIDIAGQGYWLQAQAQYTEKEGQPLLEGTFQDITERKRLDVALAAAAADSAVGTDFFITILQSLAQAVDAEHALISLITPQSTGTASSHAYIKNGQPQPNLNYTLSNTPCDAILQDGLSFVTSNIQTLHPQKNIFGLAKIESYIGVSIKDSQGDAIGVLVLLAQKPLPTSAQVRALLHIFAERIAGELRRADDQEKIFNLAFFDPLTRLPNRRMLLDRLKLALAQSSHTGQHGALLFIDLDHFKMLNDTRGHHIGDQLLVQVAERISSIIGSTDLVARLGGDEFVVIFDGLGNDAKVAAIEAKTRAETLHELITLPYPLQQSMHHCTISIGVNLYSSEDRSVDDLLRHADAAMYQAKDSGRNAIRFFDPHLQLHLEKRASIETDLRAALELGQQLTPHFQIQVNHLGEAQGAELLLRWYHPSKGMISPGEFIPVAEHTGLIIMIGKQVIEQACAQLYLWQQQPMFAHLTLAVNVSPIQFNQPNFVDDVLAEVAASGIVPQRLKLELTESSLLKNVDQSIEKMQQLQNAGIGFSMDDFGIGYSSLSYLKRLPLDQLKIDQSFVRDIALDPNDRVIVRTIIAMAQNMNLQVIAEGVETAEQKDFLERNGCTLFQGYYFGMPSCLAEFEQQILASHKAKQAALSKLYKE